MAIGEKIDHTQKVMFNKFIRYGVMEGYNKTTIDKVEKYFFKFQEFISGIAQFIGLFFIFQLVMERLGFELTVIALLIGQGLLMRKKFKEIL